MVEYARVNLDRKDGLLVECSVVVTSRKVQALFGNYRWVPELVSRTKPHVKMSWKSRKIVFICSISFINIIDNLIGR